MSTYKFDRKAMMYRNRKVYTMKDIEAPSFQFIVGEARRFWNIRCDEYVANHKGPMLFGCVHMTTVGMEIYVILPRKHIPIKYIILHPEFGYNYEPIWCVSADEIQSYLKFNGIDCTFNQGKLD